MKLGQYTRQEQKIAAADGSGIRQRWLWGLRLLRDPQAMSTGDSGPRLKHGITAAMVEAARERGIKLSAREIRYRIQCARAYPKESQLGSAAAEFATWRDLCDAGFPPFDPDEEGEPEADHRTDAERAEAARAEYARLLDGGDGKLEIHLAHFPAGKFDPNQTTLKDLVAYADDMERMTASFQESDKRRREYIDEMREAVDDDLSATWADAHKAAYGTEEVDEQGSEAAGNPDRPTKEG